MTRDGTVEESIYRPEPSTEASLACEHGLSRARLQELNRSGKICISSRLTQVGGQAELLEAAGSSLELADTYFLFTDSLYRAQIL